MVRKFKNNPPYGIVIVVHILIYTTAIILIRIKKPSDDTGMVYSTTGNPSSVS